MRKRVNKLEIIIFGGLILPFVYFILVSIWLNYLASIDSNPNQNAMVLGGLFLILSVIVGWITSFISFIILYIKRKKHKLVSKLNMENPKQ